MKKYIKKLVFLIFLEMYVIPVFAGQFGQNEFGFYYVKDDGQLAKNEWIEYDSDNDELLEYFHFNEFSLLDVNKKTIDGYQVNEKGQWVENGSVKTKDGQTKNNNTNSTGSGIIDKTFDATTDAYKKGLQAGSKAVQEGIDAGAKAVDSTLDVYSDMYGGIFKGAVNEYKKEYDKVIDNYKEEYGKIMNDYSNQMDGIMNQYKNALKGLW